MTFVVDWSEKVKPGPGNRQVWHGCLNLIHEFVQSIGGYPEIEKRDRNHIPKCAGITEWAQKRYGISVVDGYTTRTEHHSYLGPNPMDGVDTDVMNWATPFIPYNSFDPPWGYFGGPSKDDLSLFLDPVFVGPRSLADRKFFHSQKIKAGIRKKSLGSRRAYEKCETPELRRWHEDVSTSRFMFASCGLEAATEWATARGWKEGRFWSTTHLDVDHFAITLPGCEGKPETYEKLLFVLKFSGKN